VLVSIAASWRPPVLQSSAHRRFSDFKEGTEPVQHRPQIRASVMPPSSRSGTIDPTKAARLALQGAAPVASLLITTEVMVAKKTDKTSAPMLIMSVNRPVSASKP
jgi:hypothetical protein